MKKLNRKEFKELIEKNPNKRFAFFEYEPDVFLDQIHITDDGSGFGATSFVSTLEDNEDFLFDYDWSITGDYTDDDLFAVLDDDELLSIYNLLKEVIFNGNDT